MFDRDTELDLGSKICDVPHNVSSVHACLLQCRLSAPHPSVSIAATAQRDS